MEEYNLDSGARRYQTRAKQDYSIHPIFIQYVDPSEHRTDTKFGQIKTLDQYLGHIHTDDNSNLPYQNHALSKPYPIQS